MKIALMFVGQGAQAPGMGRELYEAAPAARAVFDTAGEDIRRLCFEGSSEELARTDVTQPCLYVATMAAFEALREALASLGLAPSMAAGFSLGEYAALTAGGVFTLPTGVAVVQKRGQWMQEAAAGGGGMAAAMGPLDAIEAICREAAEQGMCLPVNYNCPGQTVVAADASALDVFLQKAAAAGVKAVPLKVSGPFHSPRMDKAAARLAELFQNIRVGEPSMAVYANVTARDLRGEDIRDLMCRQVWSPVLWDQTVRNMAAAGADVFVEVGPGKTLRGLLRRILPGAVSLNVEDAMSLQKTVETLKNMRGEQAC